MAKDKAKGKGIQQKAHNGETSRLRCTCVSAFQDSVYGKGIRVHNGTSKGYRCTVCQKDK